MMWRALLNTFFVSIFVCLAASFAMAGIDQTSLPSIGACPSMFAKLSERILNPPAVQTAKTQIARQIEANLANPPTTSVRVFEKSEIQIDPVRRKFHKFEEQFGRPKENVVALKRNIHFTDSHGRKRSIEVLVQYEDEWGLTSMEKITELISNLPADMLEAVKIVKVRDAQAHNSKGDLVVGSAFGSKTTLYRGGVDERTLRHEVGHNLANLIWNNPEPPVEWTQAFEQDGRKFVSGYANRMFKKTQLTEDFAEAVEGYLRDTNTFRNSFPHRAAFLDTLFHRTESPNKSVFASGSPWHLIRTHNKSIPVMILREAQDRKTQILVAKLAAIEGVIVLTAYSLPKIQEFTGWQSELPTATPDRHSTPRPTPQVNPN